MIDYLGPNILGIDDLLGICIDHQDHLIAQIDALVYELYGLTEEEIAIVEEERSQNHIACNNKAQFVDERAAAGMALPRNIF